MTEQDRDLAIGLIGESLKNIGESITMLSEQVIKMAQIMKNVVARVDVIKEEMKKAGIVN